MSRRWRAAQAGYEPLPGGERWRPAGAAGAAARGPSPPPHAAVAIPSDREHAVTQALLSYARLDVGQLFDRFQTSSQGLEEREAARRL